MQDFFHQQELLPEAPYAPVAACEAYALADRGGDKFSGEVIRTLLTEVPSAM